MPDPKDTKDTKSDSVRAGVPPAAAHGAYRATTEIRVRFRDTDGMGHVNNAVYLTYLEVAREQYWREVFGLTDYRQVDIIMARVEIDFRAPIVPGDTIIVGLRASALGRRSFDFQYEGWRKGDGAVVFASRSVQVMYDYAAGGTKDLSPEARAKILAFEAPGSVALRGAADR
jgi:acyl-CoA thioester hydrolase